EVRAAGRAEMLEEERDAVAHATLLPVARTGPRACHAVHEVEIDDRESPQRGDWHRQPTDEAENRDHIVPQLPAGAHDTLLCACWVAVMRGALLSGVSVKWVRVLQSVWTL